MWKAQNQVGQARLCPRLEFFLRTRNGTKGEAARHNAPGGALLPLFESSNPNQFNSHKPIQITQTNPNHTNQSKSHKPIQITQTDPNHTNQSKSRKPIQITQTDPNHTNRSKSHKPIQITQPKSHQTHTVKPTLRRCPMKLDPESGDAKSLQIECAITLWM